MSSSGRNIIILMKDYGSGLFCVFIYYLLWHFPWHSDNEDSILKFGMDASHVTFIRCLKIFLKAMPCVASYKPFSTHSHCVLGFCTHSNALLHETCRSLIRAIRSNATTSWSHCHFPPFF